MLNVTESLARSIDMYKWNELKMNGTLQTMQAEKAIATTMTNKNNNNNNETEQQSCKFSNICMHTRMKIK